MCLDKGYDSRPLRARLQRRHYTLHLKSRGQEQREKRTRGKRARRLVVQRVASWLNRYRRILVRWEKKVENYQSLLHLVFAHILWRSS
ncbi:transposase [Pirellulimonas nuda]|uniref:transposase n=1 Tax=Pirellulimonas nuda TaxID=2528009 RepID=UPI00119FFCBA